MQVAASPSFRRQFKKLSSKLQEEALEKIELFRDPKCHEWLKVHKLKGELAGRWSFSVNYQCRILFVWEVQKKSVILIAIGDHSVYD